MANLRIAPLNFHAQSTLTTTHELTALPFTNSQNIARALVYRSTDALPYAPLGSGNWAGDTRKINCFALFRHNLRNATVRLRLYSDLAMTAPVYDSGTVAVGTTIAATYDWGYTVNGPGTDPLLPETPFMLWFTQVTGVKAYKIDVGAGTWAGSYVEVGSIFLGNALEFTYNPSSGLGLGWETNSSQVRTRGGSLRSNNMTRWKSLTFDLGWLAEAQRSTFLEVMAISGLVYDVLVSVHPEDGTRLERDYGMHAKFTSLEAITRNNTFATTKVQLREL